MMVRNKGLLSLKRIKKSPFLILLTLFSWAQLSAQVKLSADSNHVETGNLFALHLDIPLAKGKPDTLLIAPWNFVIGAENIRRQTAWTQTGATFRKTILVLFFEADTVQIPALPLLFSGSDTVFSNPLQIIVTATPAPEDLRDMAPIKDISMTSSAITRSASWGPRIRR